MHFTMIRSQKIVNTDAIVKSENKNFLTGARSAVQSFAFRRAAVSEARRLLTRKRVTLNGSSRKLLLDAGFMLI